MGMSITSLELPAQLSHLIWVVRAHEKVQQAGSRGRVGGHNLVAVENPENDTYIYPINDPVL